MLIVDREAYLVLGAATGFALAGRFRRQEPSIASAVAATAAVRICAAILCLPKSAFSNTLAVAWFEILASAVVTVASIFGSIVAYRLLFHPLTRYPGPKIAAVTQLWTFWQRAQCRGAFVNEKLHELYGDIVRIGPNHLIIRDAQALQTMSKQWIKGKHYTVLLPREQSLLQERDPAKHREYRRRWNKAFTPDALAGYEAPLQTTTALLCDALRSCAGSSIDLHDYLAMFVWDIMSVVVFGRSWDLLRKGDFNRAARQGLSRYARRSNAMAAVPWARNLAPLFDRMVHGTSEGGASEFREMCIRLGKERIDNGSHGAHDVLGYLAKEDDDQVQPLDAHRASREAVLGVAAGADTTVNALVSIFWRLLSQPNDLAALRKAIDDALEPATQQISVPAAAKIPLLTATIKEALRLDPLVSIGTQRTSPPIETVIGGKFVIPPNTEVTATTLAIAHDPRYFGPDALEFRPSRWLDGSRIDEDAYAPFAVGPASCVGRALAMQELQLVLATLLQNFDFSFARDFDAEAFRASARDTFVVERIEPLKVIVTPR